MTVRWITGVLVASVLLAADRPAVARSAKADDSRGSAQAGRAFTTNFTKEEFAARRARVYEAIGPDAVALMQGLPSVHSSAIFRQSNEFFYLSGVVAPQALLLMDGADEEEHLCICRSRTRAARPTEGDLLSSDDPAKTARDHRRRRSEVARPARGGSAGAHAREGDLRAVRADGRRERKPGRRAPAHGGRGRGSVGRPHQPRGASARAAEDARAGSRDRKICRRF